MIPPIKAIPAIIASGPRAVAPKVTMTPSAVAVVAAAVVAVAAAPPASAASAATVAAPAIAASAANAVPPAITASVAAVVAIAAAIPSITTGAAKSAAIYVFIYFKIDYKYNVQLFIYLNKTNKLYKLLLIQFFLYL
jgi:hypothetical protein